MTIEETSMKTIFSSEYFLLKSISRPKPLEVNSANKSAMWRKNDQRRQAKKLPLSKKSLRAPEDPLDMSRSSFNNKIISSYTKIHIYLINSSSVVISKKTFPF